ncbi:HK97 gp10 family phage protein [Cytobacillus praedii]|uniref:HK97 gp10 family phage protein n=1 Tax=Cytobacillus praedii TaxID=1742358 RepID=A0A4R1APW3_9BACI|nr:HK97 gp10 family phage protein [Cytobacillus praedii]TCJ01496.1 HK97 gp10 family phage protein [Cytobacillus praedii]
MGFEYSEMKAMRKQIAELRRNSYEIHMKVAKRIAQLAIRKVKKMTPVDTGDLRNNWKFTVTKKGDSFYVTVYNKLEYASFVENGHRIVVAGQTVGWVEGKFMLKLTMDEMERIAPNMWKQEVEKEMRRIFGQ